MKTLLLMRHAKSSWKNPELTDHDRPLNKRGKRNATRMGELLREQDLIPDVIISSTAERAHLTAKRVAESSGYGGEIRLHPGLYFEGPADWEELLCDVSADVHRLLLVTHNPTIEECLEMLTGEDEMMPTATVANIQLAINDWNDIKFDGTGQLVNLWRPRELS